MSLLKPAKNKMAFAKVGIYGSAGSGKSYTASNIAIGLHQEIKSTKPIAIFDTEPAFSWLIPKFDKAGIEILVMDESRALADLMTFMDEAEKTSDIVIIDSITHVWREAQEAYLKKVNAMKKKKGEKQIYKLEFHHWNPIKASWQKFTDRFLSSKMHAIVCGRSGTIYEYQEKDDGSNKKELISTGTKMATEKELGYEPSLLIEMLQKRDDGKIINFASVIKDRSDNINGQEFNFPTFRSFKPHFDRLNLGGEHFDSMGKRDSTSLYDVDEQGWDKEKQQRQIWSEEIIELMKKYAPSQSVEDKQKRSDWMEKYFSTRSWTSIENMKSVDLRDAFKIMRSDFEAPNVEAPKEEVTS